MTAPFSVGRRVRIYRTLRRLSQSALARAVGVAPAYMSQIESGTRTASTPLLARIAHEVDTTEARMRNNEKPTTFQDFIVVDIEEHESNEGLS